MVEKEIDGGEIKLPLFHRGLVETQGKCCSGLYKKNLERLFQIIPAENISARLLDTTH